MKTDINPDPLGVQHHNSRSLRSPVNKTKKQRHGSITGVLSTVYENKITLGSMQKSRQDELMTGFYDFFLNPRSPVFYEVISRFILKKSLIKRMPKKFPFLWIYLV